MGATAALAFQSEAWAAARVLVMPLTRVFRQEQAAFVELLHELRLGRCGPASRALLRGRVGRRPPPGAPVTCLRARNRDVDALNAAAFAALPGATHAFSSQDEGPDAGELAALQRHCPAPAHLELKIGAAVVLVRNLRVHTGLVNGSQGRVVGFTSAPRHDGQEGGWPVVRFDGVGVVVPVTPQVWTVEHGWGTAWAGSGSGGGTPSSNLCWPARAGTGGRQGKQPGPWPRMTSELDERRCPFAWRTV